MLTKLLIAGIFVIAIGAITLIALSLDNINNQNH